MSKVRTERNPPALTNLSSYRFQWLPSSHSSCFNVQYKSSLTIKHPTKTTHVKHNQCILSDIATPSELLPFQNILYRDQYTSCSYHPCIIQYPCLTITLIHSQFVLSIVTCITDRDSIRLLYRTTT